jgi:hypothetical protein
MPKAAPIIDRAASFLRPVDILEVKDQRELVERQRSSDAEHHREQQHRVVAGTKADDRRARSEARQDAGHQVMEVHALDRAARPAANPADTCVAAHHRKRQHEREQQEEEGLTACAVDVVLVARHELEEIRHP